MIYSFLSVPFLFAFAFIIIILRLKSSPDSRVLPATATLGSLGALILTVLTIPDLLLHGVLSYQMEGWPAPFGITIAVDSLTIFLALIITFMGLLVTLFSYRFISERRTEYYSILMILLAGLLGIVHTGDLFNLFVFFEIMSISSYVLVSFKRDGYAIEASIKYLIMGSFATSLMLFGIAFIYGATGTLNMADLALKASQATSPIFPIALGLIITGMALKAGLVPFHTWLPDAHPAAPSPISAMLSGVVINLGIYAIIRVVFTVFSGPSGALNVLLVLGLASMIVGAVLALMQSDLKRLLAYSSISQMGYIGMAIGLGTSLGAVSGLFHIMNHAVIKALLFFCAGAIIYQVKTSEMKKINLKFSPVIMYAFLIGVLALAGIPFFNGFSSKLLIYLATFEVSPFLTIISLLVSILTLAYGLKAFYLIFLVNVDPGTREHRVPLTMSIPLVVLAAVCIFFGLFPQYGVQVSEFAASGLNNNLYISRILGI